jgi:CRISPR-associated endoribonuclease Cas6
MRLEAEKTMLTSTVVRLRAKQDGCLPRAMGEYGHAAFLSLIREVAPDLSKAIHEAGNRQPYTVSPLIGGKRERRGVSVRTGGGYWMRFTILDPALYSVFSRYFAESISFEPVLTLGKVPFVIEEVTTSQQPDSWSGYATFSKLFTEAHLEPIVSLQFLSLTAFSLGKVPNVGPRFSIFPEPSLVFDSLLRQWNQFAAQPLKNHREWQEWISQHVIVRRYRTESDLWQFKQHPQIGFVGHCTYEVKGDCPEEIRQFNALTDFAFFAGVGCRTTMGMGQVRRLKNAC